MDRRIATGIGGVMTLILLSTGAAAAEGQQPAATPVVTESVVLTAHPAALGPICLDSAGFGGVYCIWPEQPSRRPARNAPPAPPQPAPPPAGQNQPPAAS